jgi:hypothetical protein
VDFGHHRGRLVESHYSHELAKLHLELGVGNIEASTAEPGNEELMIVSKFRSSVVVTRTMKNVMTRTVPTTAAMM